MRRLTSLPDIAANLREVVDIARRMRKHYLDFPPSNARDRRLYESRNTVELTRFEFKGHEYAFAYETLCQRTMIYARGYYEKDGVKVTLRALTKCLDEIQAELNRKGGE